MSSCFDATSRWTAPVTSDESFGLAPWVTLALCLHGAIALAHHAVPATKAVIPAPLEVDLVPPAAKPEPPPVPAPVAQEAAPAPQARPEAPTRRHQGAEPARGPARAGKVLTVGDADEAGDPISFVTDPEGRTYGAGVVARGGVAEKSTEAGPIAAPKGEPGPRSSEGDALTPASDLSRRPQLEGDDPCRGFFPSRADRDEGHVTLAIVVQPTGAVGSVSVLAESPLGEGFGDAARTCLAAQRFVPALDRAGRATRTATRVRIHFTR